MLVKVANIFHPENQSPYCPKTDVRMSVTGHIVNIDANIKC